MSDRSMTFDDFSSSKNRQQRITRVAVGAGILMALLLAFKLIQMEDKGALPPGALATVESMQGKLLIKRGAKIETYEPGFMVMAGDAFQTIGDSMAVISYLDDGTRITLGPGTTLLFNGSEGGKRTNLSGGTATFEVSQQPEGRPMVLASYNADATVNLPGTIEQKYSGLATYFTVKSGQLKVRRYSDGRITRVKAGQSHTCRPEDMGVIKFNPNGLE